MIIQSHPTGNANVKHVARALNDAQLLCEFWTCLSWNPDSPVASLLPESLKKQLERRAFDADLRDKTRVAPWRELARLIGPNFRVVSSARRRRGWASVNAVYQDLDRRVAARLRQIGTGGSISGIYAYEDGALRSFEAAHALGLTRFYDLPIAYWETSRLLLSEEAQRWPQWEPTLVGTRDGQAKLERKTRELDLADVVVVPSQFVFDSLPQTAHDSKKCVIVPFGSPTLVGEALTAADNGHKDLPKRPLRVLFAGSMTQRKGLADLFAAVKLLGRADVELVVLGTPVAPLDFYRAQGVEFRYEPPRSHSEVLSLMQSCDILALPSIVEGRALVQQEAMACGLPLLVTPNAGGQDLIDEGETGFLVPIRSPEIIAEKLSWFADNREQLSAMSAYARGKAAQYTWRSYQEKIVGAVCCASGG